MVAAIEADAGGDRAARLRDLVAGTPAFLAGDLDAEPDEFPMKATFE